MLISKRLDTILHMIEPCSMLADIGCDHGIVSVEALRRGVAERVIAADVAPGPLEAARRNAEAAGLTVPDRAADTEHAHSVLLAENEHIFIEEKSAFGRNGIEPEPGATIHAADPNRIEFLLSDGLTALPDDCGVSCIVIAGMGGMLISRILREGAPSRFPRLRQLVIGAQSDLDTVRHTLLDELGYTIVREVCVRDEGKYYFLMDVRTGGDSQSMSIRKDAMCGNNDFRILQGKDRDADSAECRKSTPFLSQDASTAESTDRRGVIRQNHEGYTESEYFFGKYIDAPSLPTYREYLHYRRGLTEKALTELANGTGERSEKRRAELRRQLQHIETAFVNTGGLK